MNKHVTLKNGNENRRLAVGGESVEQARILWTGKIAEQFSRMLIQIDDNSGRRELGGVRQAE